VAFSGSVQRRTYEQDAQRFLSDREPWQVTKSDFDVEQGRLDLYVDFPRGARFGCSVQIQGCDEGFLWRDAWHRGQHVAAHGFLPAQGVPARAGS